MTITEFLLARIAEDEYDANRELLLGTTTPLTRMNARVLAECAAKRAIVEHAVDVRESYWQEPEPTTRIAGRTGWLYPFDMLPVLRALATVYGDHEDYRPEWPL